MGNKTTKLKQKPTKSPQNTGKSHKKQRKYSKTHQKYPQKCGNCTKMQRKYSKWHPKCPKKFGWNGIYHQYANEVSGYKISAQREPKF